MIGRAVKIEHNGFKYAKAGDNVVGIVSEAVAPGELGEVLSTGVAPVYMGKTIQPGQEVRFILATDSSYGCLPIGGAGSYTSMGYAIGSGRGLVDVALNIRSV